MNRPKSIKVLNLDYRVEWCDDDWREQTESHGQHSYARQLIRIQKTTPQIEADTLLHEVMHAVCDGMSLADGMSEEDYVSRLSTGLLTVWRDNPKVLEWIRCNNVLQS